MGGSTELGRQEAEFRLTRLRSGYALEHVA